MEPAAAWAPCEFQLANWTVEEPTAGLPVDYVSIDIFGTPTCSLQANFPEEFSGLQQLVEYYYHSTAALRPPPPELCGKEVPQPNRPPPAVVTDEQNRVKTNGSPGGAVDLENEQTKIPNDNYVKRVVKEVVGEFKDHIDMRKEKMHRYPACLEAIDECYTVPRIVAIGPYYHGLEHLKQVEKVKHVAACHCIGEEHSLEELYYAVVPVADEVRCLYDNDVMAGISCDCDNFRHMMFFDACFFVQYMRMMSGVDIDPSLRCFMSPNGDDILRDFMLLENQLPWKVVERLMELVPLPVPLKLLAFSLRGCLQDHKLPRDKWLDVELSDNYQPPHFLGLVRYYIVGRRRRSCFCCNNNTNNAKKGDAKRSKKRSISTSAVELAEVGITLTSNRETTELIHMDLNQEGTVFAKLSLVPLSLNRDRASILVNMAAHELCTVESFSRAPDEDSAVCSYLLLLGMLVYRGEDVHELRTKGLLQGGGGLTDEQVLHFLTSIQGLRLGSCYNRIMRDIVSYKENKETWTKLYALYHNNKKIIATVVTGVGAVGGIIGTLISIKKAI
ncbi:hypothetical protein EJB05_46700, partial [Eragrostis curvula]